MSKQKVVVDQNTCIGCNTCPLIDEETFELNPETFTAQVKKQPETITEKVKTAVASCPVGAISIVDDK